MANYRLFSAKSQSNLAQTEPMVGLAQFADFPENSAAQIDIPQEARTAKWLRRYIYSTPLYHGSNTRSAHTNFVDQSL